MKSPFLVAAQMRASVEESNGSNNSREYNQDSTFSSSSSSSLSSSTSSLDGSASSSSRSSTTPSSKKAAARAATPSKSRKKQRKTRDKITSASEGLHMSMPDLDQLPGSLQLSPVPHAAPTIPALQKDFRTTSTSKIEKNERTAEESTMPVVRRSRTDTRAMREAIKLKKAKRWSNCILGVSFLFLPSPAGEED